MDIPNIDDLLQQEFPDDNYTTADCHIFVAGSNSWHDLPISSTEIPIFVAVNGVRIDYVPQLGFEAKEGDVIHAIYDWWRDIPSPTPNVIDDVIQIGSRSVWDDSQDEKFKEPEGYVNPPLLPSGRVPNQLKGGYNAFSGMFQGKPVVTGNEVIKNLDISNLTTMMTMFYITHINPDISSWDTSNVTNMQGMFADAPNFNQDISNWDTSKVTYMAGMFDQAQKFNQDLSEWCVSQISSKPGGFDNGATAWTKSKPVWGYCPRGEDGSGSSDDFEVKSYLGDYPFFYEEPLFPIEIDGVIYEEEDAHIFIANGNEVKLPIPNDTIPIFVAVNGVEKDYETEIKGNAFDGSTIHAIFDWDNTNMQWLTWINDIKQFGLNSVTNKRNQLKNGKGAFRYMRETNPTLIVSLDTSNLADMSNMFESATKFNQDLSQWCVSQFDSMPSNFDLNTTAWSESRPQWGTCPRGEDTKDYTWPITIGGKTYEKEDAHIFVSNGNGINFPIASGTKPIFVGVNGETKDPIIVTRTIEVEEIGEDGVTITTSQEIEVASIAEIETGDIIEAIFDWENPTSSWMHWFSEIKQFGLNSETGKRNQIKNGYRAFRHMRITEPGALPELDISNLTSLNTMFLDSTFNIDISNWNTLQITNMGGTFKNATKFNQDLSEWCVSLIQSYDNFDENSGFEGQTAKQPQWGTCPRGENVPNIDDILPDSYVTKDCHVFVANGKQIFLPCEGSDYLNPLGSATFIAVNGVAQPTTADSITAEDGDVIHAIFDWDNSKFGLFINWFSDILQFGLNSETGKRNQLKNGMAAFYWMTANPAAIATLDVSNLTDMANMFYAYDTSSFNQDISGWDVSNVTNMGAMFEGAFKFNQDLSQWCVSQFSSMPNRFDDGATEWTKPKPQWGTCPRGENVPNIDDILPDSYVTKDCHVFVANGNEAIIPCDGLPTFVAVNGEDVTPTTLTTRTIEVPDLENKTVDNELSTTMKEVQTTVITANYGDIIHAIFDWNNKSYFVQDWYSDILQFGSRSLGAEPEGYTNPTPLTSGRIPNQLKAGPYAFYYLGANPAAISTLDVSNLDSIAAMFRMSSEFNQNINNWDTSNMKNMNSAFQQTDIFNKDLSAWDTSKVTNMDYMFALANFNQDISGWDVSNVTRMNSMFSQVRLFNQDLSQWCVINIASEPSNFAYGTSQWTKPKPQWGKCP